jgi:hypothetical protein
MIRIRYGCDPFRSLSYYYNYIKYRERLWYIQKRVKKRIKERRATINTGI